jgi:hypothetical protein
MNIMIGTEYELAYINGCYLCTHINIAVVLHTRFAQMVIIIVVIFMNIIVIDVEHEFANTDGNYFRTS